MKDFPSKLSFEKKILILYLTIAVILFLFTPEHPHDVYFLIRSMISIFYPFFPILLFFEKGDNISYLSIPGIIFWIVFILLIPKKITNNNK